MVLFKSLVVPESTRNGFDVRPMRCSLLLTHYWSTSVDFKAVHCRKFAMKSLFVHFPRLKEGTCVSRLRKDARETG